MRDLWLEILDRVLRPARPHLERCLRERERHLADRRLFSEERLHAIANCERRIHELRAVVFAKDDGVVGMRMTDLEREWRSLSRRDPDAGLMDLWARIAPASWIDRKLWRGSAPSAWLDAAVALASDFENIEAAEAAVEALWPGSRIRWRFCESGSEIALFEALPTATMRAQRVEQKVHTAALARFPNRPHLAADLGRAAAIDVLDPASSKVRAMRALWKTGYVVSSVEATVTLEIPCLLVESANLSSAPDHGRAMPITGLPELTT